MMKNYAFKTSPQLHQYRSPGLYFRVSDLLQHGEYPADRLPTACGGAIQEENLDF